MMKCGGWRANGAVRDAPAFCGKTRGRLAQASRRNTTCTLKQITLMTECICVLNIYK